ncbi:MAG: class I SAM-dependent methyltransferase [Candidatus Hodarchaeota archaeon]
MNFVDSILQLLTENNVCIHRDSVILDFGCGRGDLVREFIDLEYSNIYGCDIALNTVDKEEIDETCAKSKYVIFENDFFSEAKANKLIRQIELSPYRLPFQDGQFDLIISNQVFEHVLDYTAVLNEIKRVLKPGGFCLNFFPSKYRFIEPHVLVPFAGTIKCRLWLYIWFLLLKRKREEEFVTKKNEGNSVFQITKQITERNLLFLNYEVKYFSKNRLRKYFNEFFFYNEFIERYYVRLKLERRKRTLYGALARLPFITNTLGKLYSTFHERIVLLQKDK